MGIMYVFKHIMCVQYLQRSGEGIRSSAAGVRESRELSCGNIPPAPFARMTAEERLNEEKPDQRSHQGASDSQDRWDPD